MDSYNFTSAFKRRMFYNFRVGTYEPQTELDRLTGCRRVERDGEGVPNMAITLFAPKQTATSILEKERLPGPHCGPSTTHFGAMRSLVFSPLPCSRSPDPAVLITRNETILPKRPHPNCTDRFVTGFELIFRSVR